MRVPSRPAVAPTAIPSELPRRFLIRTPLLLATCIAAIATPALAQTPGKPAITALTMRTGGEIEPERMALRIDHADLVFEVLPAEKTLKGVATLKLTTSAPQSRLLIDLDRNLLVSAISVDGRALAPGAWSNPEGRLTITLPRPLAAGAKPEVKITYGGIPHVAVRAPWDDGIVWGATRDGKTWMSTTAQGYGCDLYWPCLDFPQGEPAGVDLHITVPTGLSAPSNGVLVKREQLPDGRTTFHWRSTSINPYLVSLNVAPYKEISATYDSRFGNRFPMTYWYLPGREQQAAGLFEEFPQILDFFEAVVGPYPWSAEKMGVVETPYLGMEHQTINAYGNNYAKDATGFDWLLQHEFAHEWFGNQMTAARWDDFWLHEGYAQYMQPLYGRWREGEPRYAVMMEEFRLQIANRAPIVSGRNPTSEEVYEDSGSGPGSDIYVKGAWVLHTLRNTIGDDAFWDVTRRVVYGRPDPKPGNFKPRFATTDEFVETVNKVTGKDYRWFFDVYLRQAALPELVQQRAGTRLTLSWKAPGGAPFPLPVEVQVDGKVQLVPMTGGTATLEVPERAHVVVDPASRLLKRSAAVEAVQRRRS
ncbi:peptidase M1 [Nostoc sp. 3335mG]|nr:peptidase M1 [Nostoc sp. 3335mG]